MSDLIEALRNEADYHRQGNRESTGAKAIDAAVAEIERLRALLRHADNVVIWEHTPARPGFQEEIEAALGIGG